MKDHRVSGCRHSLHMLVQLQVAVATLEADAPHSPYVAERRRSAEVPAAVGVKVEWPWLPAEDDSEAAFEAEFGIHPNDVPF